MNKDRRMWIHGLFFSINLTNTRIMIIKSQINDQLSQKTDHQGQISPNNVDNLTKIGQKIKCG